LAGTGCVVSGAWLSSSKNGNQDIDIKELLNCTLDGELIPVKDVSSGNNSQMLCGQPNLAFGLHEIVFKVADSPVGGDTVFEIFFDYILYLSTLETRRNGEAGVIGDPAGVGVWNTQEEGFYNTTFMGNESVGWNIGRNGVAFTTAPGASIITIFNGTYSCLALITIYSLNV
jgi:hypothetical protein